MNLGLKKIICGHASVTLIALMLVSQNALGFNISTALLGCYEVLSYRDDPTKLDGGSVSIGDAFDQTSYTGASFGLGTQVGIFKIEHIEPFVAIDLLSSQLSKSAVSDGISSEGDFSFINTGLGLGGRLWLGRSLNVTAAIGFSRSVSDQMSTSKKDSGSGQSLGEIEYSTSGHKKTSAHLGLSFLPSGSGLMLGVEARIGSGCFECSSKSSALQKRAYLTRAGAVSVAWLFGESQNEYSNNEMLEEGEKQLESKFKSKKKEIRRKRKSNKKQVPALEESL